MPVRIPELMPRHIQALLQLGSGGPYAEDVGLEVGGMSDDLLIASYELARIGLAETLHGWRGTAWFRLSARGHALRHAMLR